MDKLDRTIHRMLKRRPAGIIIRGYGVAEFTRRVRWYAWRYGREAGAAIWTEELPEGFGEGTKLAMVEALATAFY